MKWTEERDKSQTHHALVLKPDEPLGSAFVEYWKRILTDGCANADTSHWVSLGFDIAERQIEDDDQGCIRAVFFDGLKKECRALGHFYVRSDAFTLLQPPGEDNNAFNRRQIRWYLQQYTLLKQATETPEVKKLLARANGIHPLPVQAATAYGWFDLNLGKPSFGRLPREDRAMLDGNDPPLANPLKDLMGGVVEFD